MSIADIRSSILVTNNKKKCLLSLFKTFSCPETLQYATLKVSVSQVDVQQKAGETRACPCNIKCFTHVITSTLTEANEVLSDVFGQNVLQKNLVDSFHRDRLLLVVLALKVTRRIARKQTKRCNKKGCLAIGTKRCNKKGCLAIGTTETRVLDTVQKFSRMLGLHLQPGCSYFLHNTGCVLFPFQFLNTLTRA